MSELAVWTIFDIIITAVEMYMYSYFFRKHDKKIRNRGIRLLILSGINLIVVVLTFFNTPVLVKGLVFLSLCPLAFYFMYKLKFSQVLLYLLVAYAILSVCETIVAQSWEYIMDRPIKFLVEGRRAILMEIIISIKIVGFFTLVLVDRLFINKLKQYRIHEVSALMFQSVAIIIGWGCIDRYIQTDNEVIALISIGCGFIFLFYLFQSIGRSNQFIEIERKKRLEKLSVYEQSLKQTYYEEKLQDELQVREVYHDLKKQLQLLKENGKAEDRQILAAQLKEKIAGYGDYVRTGNEYLDILLKKKRAGARELGIEIEVQEICEECSRMDSVDLCAVIELLLDHVMADSGRGNEEGKKIRLRCFSRKNMLVISGERKSSENIQKNKDMRSMKKLRSIVLKYDGEWNEQEDGINYVFTILLPMNKEGNRHE